MYTCTRGSTYMVTFPLQLAPKSAQRARTGSQTEDRFLLPLVPRIVRLSRCIGVETRRELLHKRNGSPDPAQTRESIRGRPTPHLITIIERQTGGEKSFNRRSIVMADGDNSECSSGGYHGREYGFSEDAVSTIHIESCPPPPNGVGTVQRGRRIQRRPAP
jgi:hypothetical protein